jgi:hypothetical protein
VKGLTKYDVGDRVRMEVCPDPGTVVEVKRLLGWNEYRMDWDDWPDDHGWYTESQLRPEKETGHE